MYAQPLPRLSFCKPILYPIPMQVLVVMADSPADSEQADDPSNLVHCFIVKAHPFYGVSSLRLCPPSKSMGDMRVK
jgi:hypothetical protein